MLALSAVLLISALSAGLFLRAESKTVIISSVSALAAGDILFLALGKFLPEPVCFIAGAVIGALVFMLASKRGILDSVLFLCVSLSTYCLWPIFRDALSPHVNEEVVLFLYCMLFIAHIPAVLLSFDRLRLRKDWQANARVIYLILVPVVCVLIPLMLTVLLFLGGEGAWDVLKIPLAALVFWMGILLMTLLVSFGRGREQTIAQDAYHDDMNTFMNVVRSQRHDYNLHVQTVASLIAQEKWDECRAYVNALVHDTNSMNEVLLVKDPAVAALIHNYRQTALQRGIDFEMDIRDDMADVVTTAYETNKLIGNLLQNALDELEKHDEPGEIELAIFKRGEYCMVRVSNKVSDPEAFARHMDDIFRQGYTTKTGHDGVGLSSIKALAESKGGSVTCWQDGDTVRFVASIPIRLNINEE